MHVLLNSMTSHCTFLRKGVVNMDLLCDEIYPMSPLSTCSTCDDDDKKNRVLEGEDCGHVLQCLMEKEAESLPQKEYSFLVQTNQLIGSARRRAGDWILMSQRRLCLSTGTAFTAMNYLDRFISTARCEGWENWMFELLSLACLTVASKLCDTEIPPLQQFLQGPEKEFHPKLVQKMELTLMKQLGWRMNSTVSFSYTSLLHQQSSSQYAPIDERITEFLITALLDPTFLEFRPSSIAISAFRCASQVVMFPSKTPLDFDAMLPQNQKNELMRCQMIMERKAKLPDEEDHQGGNGIWPDPTSPVTVLKPETFEYYKASTRKRKRKDM